MRKITIILAMVAAMLRCHTKAEDTLPAGATEQEVVFQNPQARIRLAGTLTMPANQPKALAVLVTGSGSQNRDEEVLGHRPFRALAYGLAANGIATLRYDDRGIGGSDAGPKGATTDDFARDAACAIAWADSAMNANATSRVPIGLIGHSEGGSIAIKQAAANPQCEFIVTLAAPAVKGDSLLISQLKSIMGAEGQIDKFEKMYPHVRARYNMVISPMPEIALRWALWADVQEQEPLATKLPQVQQQALAEIEAMISPWYRNFLRYDPTADIQAISKPWLAINGEKDTQVPPYNLQRIAELNPNAQTELIPELNHLLIKCMTGSPNEYPRLPGDIDPAVIEAINAFIDTKIACK